MSFWTLHRTVLKRQSSTSPCICVLWLGLSRFIFLFRVCLCMTYLYDMFIFISTYSLPKLSSTRTRWFLGSLLKSSGLGSVSAGIHITAQQKTSALRYLNRISSLKFVISEFWNSKSPWSLTFKGLNNAFCTSPLLFNYLYHNPLWTSEWYKAFKPPIT